MPLDMNIGAAFFEMRVGLADSRPFGREKHAEQASNYPSQRIF